MQFLDTAPQYSVNLIMTGVVVVSLSNQEPQIVRQAQEKRTNDYAYQMHRPNLRNKVSAKAYQV